MTDTHLRGGRNLEYSFKNKRLVGFIDSGDEFWEGLEEGAFRLSKCAGCDRWMWEANFRGGPTVRCGECGSWDLVWVDVEPKGVIYAWTRSHRAYPGAEARAEDVPYVTLDVEVGGAGGPRVLGVLKGGREGLKVGAPVVGSIDPPSEKTRGYAGLRWSISS